MTFRIGTSMNDELLESLLREGEHSSLDYKRDQYRFVGASDEDKSELLKDILAFANGWRQADAHILIGVDEVVGERSIVTGVAEHIRENDLQQFVNSKTNRPIAFSYRAYQYEGKQIGIITIPKQQRPFFIGHKFGKVEKKVVYYRQGTTTAIADPDEIARMGAPVELLKVLDDQREAAKKELVRVTVGISVGEGLYADIFNCGDVPVHIKEVSVCKQLSPDTVTRLPLLVAVADGKGSVEYVVPGHTDCDLPVRKQVRYLLPRFPAATIQQLSGGAPEKLWLSVSSFGGEVYRTPAEQMQPVLVELGQMLHLLEEQAKPKIMKVVFYPRNAGGFKQEVGSMNARLERLGGRGPVQAHFDAISGITITHGEADRLTQDLLNGKVIGHLGEYEWQVD
jgi:hypothetical protein